jgi:hypothetical protein
MCFSSEFIVHKLLKAKELSSFDEKFFRNFIVGVHQHLLFVTKRRFNKTPSTKNKFN